LKLFPTLEAQVKEEIWAKIAKRLGKLDVDVRAKTIVLGSAKVTVCFDVDLHIQEG